MLVLVNVVLPTVTVAATDPAVRVRVALVSERLSPVRVPADRVTDPAAPPNSPQAPVFGPSIGSLKMLLGGVQNLSQIILAGVSRSRVKQSWLARRDGCSGSWSGTFYLTRLCLRRGAAARPPS